MTTVIWLLIGFAAGWIGCWLYCAANKDWNNYQDWG